MKLLRVRSVFILCLGLGTLAYGHGQDPSTAFLEAAKELFDSKNARPFMQDGDKADDGLMQLMSGLGSLMGAAKGGGDSGGEIDYMSMIGSVIDGISNAGGGASKSKRSYADNSIDDEESSGGFDFESMLNIASMFMGQKGNAEGAFGLLPVIMNIFSGSTSTRHADGTHDHSDHSWYMPPIIEKMHVVWDHFSNSELGQTLWKNSGLANIVGKMTSNDGTIDYEKIMESFENPSLRKRWLSSLTNFVAEWMSHVSDPTTQQRYLATAQFVGNSFLKAQGYPKSVMFDMMRPAESLSMLVNVVARRHLNMRLDSYKYIKPGVSYAQELMNLASEKGFIMSRINARELSKRLHNLINSDLINPLLKAYRAYKWGIKEPHCAAHVLCAINQKKDDREPEIAFRIALTKAASFPAAWGISNKSNNSFWQLYGAILETDNCDVKYPADCSGFHEEEVRVTTEYAHSEL